MLKFIVMSVLCLVSTSLFSTYAAATEAPPTTVSRTRGHSVFLCAGINDRSKVTDVQWSQRSSKNTIAQYLKGNITYFGSEEIKQRITLHPSRFCLEIRDLQREDSDVYEVTVTASSGSETQVIVRLEVYEPTESPQNEIITISSSVASVVAVLFIICLVYFIARQVRRGQQAQDNGDSPPETIYAQAQEPKRRAAGRQPPEGIELIPRQLEGLDLPSTIYATVKSPATPDPRQARVKGAAHRNHRDSTIQEYETVNHPGTPRFASVKAGGRV
ncbi:uncharacterized protein LOC134355872 [Mobula hypostoma]|uniref:uncharacterized protein LOC134355872 n=1 Tax=Mobula hypostoma TaxID=723540 RepID=UPI002FC3C271